MTVFLNTVVHAMTIKKPPILVGPAEEVQFGIGRYDSVMEHGVLERTALQLRIPLVDRVHVLEPACIAP